MNFPITAFISPGGGELIMIMLVLILLFGAKDAPRILRSIQSFLDKMQRTAADFRYKMMYGDLHSSPTDEEPYDVEADYADDHDDCSELETQGSEPEEKKSEPETTPPETEPEAGNPEPGTENSEPRIGS